jgi:hypothetical protein
MQKYTIKLCQECGKRRRFYRIAPRMPGWASEQCSYGHCFDHEIGTLESVNKAVMDHIRPQLAENWLKPDPFIAYLKSRPFTTHE